MTCSSTGQCSREAGRCPILRIVHHGTVRKDITGGPAGASCETEIRRGVARRGVCPPGALPICFGAPGRGGSAAPSDESEGIESNGWVLA